MERANVTVPKDGHGFTHSTGGRNRKIVRGLGIAAGATAVAGGIVACATNGELFNQPTQPTPTPKAIQCQIDSGGLLAQAQLQDVSESSRWMARIMATDGIQTMQPDRRGSSYVVVDAPAAPTADPTPTAHPPCVGDGTPVATPDANAVEMQKAQSDAVAWISQAPRTRNGLNLLTSSPTSPTFDVFNNPDNPGYQMYPGQDVDGHPSIGADYHQTVGILKDAFIITDANGTKNVVYMIEGWTPSAVHQGKYDPTVTFFTSGSLAVANRVFKQLHGGGDITGGAGVDPFSSEQDLVNKANEIAGMNGKAVVIQYTTGDWNKLPNSYQVRFVRSHLPESQAVAKWLDGEGSKPASVAVGGSDSSANQAAINKLFQQPVSNLPVANIIGFNS